MKETIPTFNQADLDTYINECKSRYESSQQFVFATPAELVVGLERLFSDGYTATSRYTHQMLPPMYFSVWLTKPLHVQQSELVEVVARAQSTYQAELERARETLIYSSRTADLGTIR